MTSQSGLNSEMFLLVIEDYIGLVCHFFCPITFHLISGGGGGGQWVFHNCGEPNTNTAHRIHTSSLVNIALVLVYTLV